MARARDFEDLNNSVLNGLRNQKAESFEEPEEPVIPTYYSEDPTSFIAEPAPWESIEIVGLTQKIEIESSVLDKLKKSEVYSLGDKDLPVNKFKQEITKSVTNNQFTIVVAETGGGKSTETPQYLFEAGFTVVQT